MNKNPKKVEEAEIEIHSINLTNLSIYVTEHDSCLIQQLLLFVRDGFSQAGMINKVPYMESQRILCPV